MMGRWHAPAFMFSLAYHLIYKSPRVRITLILLQLSLFTVSVSVSISVNAPS